MSRKVVLLKTIVLAFHEGDVECLSVSRTYSFDGRKEVGILLSHHVFDGRNVLNMWSFLKI
jgi:hypothetical protein